MEIIKQTLVEHTVRFDVLESKVERGFERMDEGFARIDRMFARLIDPFSG